MIKGGQLPARCVLEFLESGIGGVPGVPAVVGHAPATGANSPLLSLWLGKRLEGYSPKSTCYARGWWYRRRAWASRLGPDCLRRGSAGQYSVPT